MRCQDNEKGGFLRRSTILDQIEVIKHEISRKKLLEENDEVVEESILSQKRCVIWFVIVSRDK